MEFYVGALHDSALDVPFFGFNDSELLESPPPFRSPSVESREFETDIFSDELGMPRRPYLEQLYNHSKRDVTFLRHLISTLFPGGYAGRCLSGRMPRKTSANILPNFKRKFDFLPYIRRTYKEFKRAKNETYNKTRFKEIMRQLTRSEKHRYMVCELSTLKQSESSE